MNNAITFDEIERKAERTLGYAFLAKAATGHVGVAYRLVKLSNGLDRLIRVLTPDKIQAFTPEQCEGLTVQLQQLHRLLASVGKSEDFVTLGHVPLLGGCVENLRGRSVDLSDVIDDFVLLGNPGFQRLMSDCNTGVGL